MKIVIALRNVVYFYLIESIVRHLARSGHHVVIVTDQVSTKTTITDRSFQACLSETRDACVSEQMLERTDWWMILLTEIRALLDYGTYFRPQHTSRWMANRYLPRRIFTNPFARSLLANGIVRGGLRLVQKFVPSDDKILRWLSKEKPDVVVALPFFWRPTAELEYVKAASALKIPTIVPVIGWDNFTLKGTFQVIPDLTIVWDRVHVEEAMAIHGLPRGKILITGAPQFDFYYEKRTTADRPSFCSKAGVDPKKPFILYLGSSGTITGRNEPEFVREFASALLAREETRELQVIVRPYPMNPDVWKPFAMENVTIWPKTSSEIVPDLPSTKQDYYDSLFHSEAVVGVNSSGIFQAAIMDKPCVTIMTEHFKKTQSGMGHFAHELKAGFLEEAYNFSESASILASLLQGKDYRADNRRRFVKEFLRPRGLSRVIGALDARAIELVAEGKSAAQIDEEIGYE
jgi:hypothetical protein